MTATDQRPPGQRGGRIASYWRKLTAARPWQLLLAASGWITCQGFLVLPPGSPPRVLLVFCFVLVCPGLAVSGLLSLREAVERWVLSIALSISFAILVSVTLTLLQIDSVALRLGLLAGITTVAVFLDIATRRPHSAQPATVAEEPAQP